MILLENQIKWIIAFLCVVVLLKVTADFAGSCIQQFPLPSSRVDEFAGSLTCTPHDFDDEQPGL